MFSKLFESRGRPQRCLSRVAPSFLKFVYDRTYSARLRCIDKTINSPESSLCQNYEIMVLKVELNKLSSLLSCQSGHFRKDFVIF